MKADFVHKDTLTNDFVENYIREHTSTKHFRICNDNCKLKQENKKLINQQKEFVKYLENEIKRYIPNLKVNEFNEDGSLKAQYINAEVFTKQPIEIVKEILAKYNEIIGENYE